MAGSSAGEEAAGSTPEAGSEAAAAAAVERWDDFNAEAGAEWYRKGVGYWAGVAPTVDGEWRVTTGPPGRLCSASAVALVAP